MAVAFERQAGDCRSGAPAGFALPATERLLLQGGDARIALDADGINGYGCAPHPDGALLAFGSSTASVVSDAGFAAAEHTRRRLLAANNESPDALYAREIGRLRDDLIDACGVSGVPGLEVVFAASGTDLHLICSQLACGHATSPARVIMIDPVETGRGVSAALTGRHFNHRAALGETVVEGAPLAGSGLVELATVPVRMSDGMPHAASAIDADVEALVEEAVFKGQRVLLVPADVSKTGMIAPSPGLAANLLRRHAGSVEVMIDACQFRIAPSTLRAYLAAGLMVALTGSKFVTGPTFSGALLIPAVVAQRLRERPLPRALAAYSNRADWPSDWAAPANLDNRANFGMLLRWEAALAELRAFRALPEEHIARFLRTFADTVETRLRDDPQFEPLPVPPLDRGPIAGQAAWDGIQTIFPFILVHSAAGARRPLNREQTMQAYRLLQADLSGHPAWAGNGIRAAIAARRCQLGQPVVCGERDGVPVSALRLCASARLVVEAVAQNRDMEVLNRAMAALDKAALLAREGGRLFDVR